MSNRPIHSVQPPFPATLYLLDSDMVDRNTLIVDKSPQAADSRPDTTQKIYHFQNCGTVYINSFNARGVRMENCGNNVPQVSNGSQNASGSPTASNEINKSNVHWQTNVISPPRSPHPIECIPRAPFHDSSANAMPHQQSGGMLHTASVPAARRTTDPSAEASEIFSARIRNSPAHENLCQRVFNKLKGWFNVFLSYIS